MFKKTLAWLLTLALLVSALSGLTIATVSADDPAPAMSTIDFSTGVAVSSGALHFSITECSGNKNPEMGYKEAPGGSQAFYVHKEGTTNFQFTVDTDDVKDADGNITFLVHYYVEGGDANWSWLSVGSTGQIGAATNWSYRASGQGDITNPLGALTTGKWAIGEFTMPASVAAGKMYVAFGACGDGTIYVDKMVVAPAAAVAADKLGRYDSDWAYIDFSYQSYPTYLPTTPETKQNMVSKTLDDHLTERGKVYADAAGTQNLYSEYPGQNGGQYVTITANNGADKTYAGTETAYAVSAQGVRYLTRALPADLGKNIAAVMNFKGAKRYDSWTGNASYTATDAPDAAAIMSFLATKDFTSYFVVNIDDAYVTAADTTNWVVRLDAPKGAPSPVLEADCQGNANKRYTGTTKKVEGDKVDSYYWVLADAVFSNKSGNNNGDFRIHVTKFTQGIAGIAAYPAAEKAALRNAISTAQSLSTEGQDADAVTAFEAALAAAQTVNGDVVADQASVDAAADALVAATRAITATESSAIRLDFTAEGWGPVVGIDSVTPDEGVEKTTFEGVSAWRVNSGNIAVKLNKTAADSLAGKDVTVYVRYYYNNNGSDANWYYVGIKDYGVLRQYNPINDTTGLPEYPAGFGGHYFGKPALKAWATMQIVIKNFKTDTLTLNANGFNGETYFDSMVIVPTEEAYTNVSATLDFTSGEAVCNGLGYSGRLTGDIVATGLGIAECSFNGGYAMRVKGEDSAPGFAFNWDPQALADADGNVTFLVRYYRERADHDYSFLSLGVDSGKTNNIVYTGGTGSWGNLAHHTDTCLTAGVWSVAEFTYNVFDLDPETGIDFRANKDVFVGMTTISTYMYVDKIVAAPASAVAADKAAGSVVDYAENVAVVDYSYQLYPTCFPDFYGVYTQNINCNTFGPECERGWVNGGGDRINLAVGGATMSRVNLIYPVDENGIRGVGHAFNPAIPGFIKSYIDANSATSYQSWCGSKYTVPETGATEEGILATLNTHSFYDYFNVGMPFSFTKEEGEHVAEWKITLTMKGSIANLRYTTADNNYQGAGIGTVTKLGNGWETHTWKLTNAQFKSDGSRDLDIAITSDDCVIRSIVLERVDDRTRLADAVEKAQLAASAGATFKALANAEAVLANGSATLADCRTAATALNAELNNKIFFVATGEDEVVKHNHDIHGEAGWETILPPTLTADKNGIRKYAYVSPNAGVNCYFYLDNVTGGLYAKRTTVNCTVTYKSTGSATSQPGTYPADGSKVPTFDGGAGSGDGSKWNFGPDLPTTNGEWQTVTLTFKDVCFKNSQNSGGSLRFRFPANASVASVVIEEAPITPAYTTLLDLAADGLLNVSEEVKTQASAAIATGDWSDVLYAVAAVKAAVSHQAVLAFPNGNSTALTFNMETGTYVYKVGEGTYTSTDEYGSFNGKNAVKIGEVQHPTYEPYASYIYMNFNNAIVSTGYARLDIVCLDNASIDAAYNIAVPEGITADSKVNMWNFHNARNTYTYDASTGTYNEKGAEANIYGYINGTGDGTQWVTRSIWMNNVNFRTAANNYDMRLSPGSGAVIAAIVLTQIDKDEYDAHNMTASKGIAIASAQASASEDFSIALTAADTRAAVAAAMGYKAEDLDAFAVGEYGGEKIELPATEENGNLVFDLLNISPDMFATDFTLTPVLKKGDEVVSTGESLHYSMKDYFEALLNDDDANKQTMGATMLIYAAAVDSYRNNVVSAIDEEVSDGMKAGLAASRPEDTPAFSGGGSVAWASASVVISNVVDLKFKVTGANNGMRLKIGDRSVAVTNGVARITLKATELNSSFEVGVYNGDTLVSSTLTYSLKAYANQMWGTDEKLTALLSSLLSYAALASAM